MIEVVTKDTSDFGSVVLEAPYTADGVTVTYQDGSECFKEL